MTGGRDGKEQRWTLRHVRRALSRVPEERGCRLSWGDLRVSFLHTQGSVWVYIPDDLPTGDVHTAGDALPWIDRLISIHGPDWSGQPDGPAEARPKGTDRVEPDAIPETNTAHGGDGASGETDNPADAGGPESDMNDQPSDGPPGMGSDSTAGEQPGGGGDMFGGAGEQSPGNATPSGGNGGAEPHGGRGDRAGGDGTASGHVGGDNPQAEPGAAPSPSAKAPQEGALMTGERGNPTQRRGSGDGASPAATVGPHRATTSPAADGTESSHKEDSVPTAEEVAAAMAALKSKARRAIRDAAQKLAEGAKGEVAEMARHRLTQRLSTPEVVRRFASSALARGDTAALEALSYMYPMPNRGGGMSKGASGGSWSHLRQTEVEKARHDLARDKEGRKLARVLRRWLETDAGGATGDPSPRISSRQLAKEIVSRRMSLAKCRRREIEPNRVVFAVDTSGSCSVWCPETWAAALEVQRADPRLVVVEHMNGEIDRVIHSGRERRRSGRQGHVEAWVELAEEMRVRTVIWVGDSDGVHIRQTLAEMHDIRIVLLDAYTSSLGLVRLAPSHVREAWCDTHIVGVASARSIRIALQGRRK